MTSTVRFGLRILLWSVLIAVLSNHFILRLNPFQGLVTSLLLLIAVLVQLIRLRKRGIIGIGIFLTGLVILTTLLSYVDERLFGHTIPRRYYGVVNRDK